MTRAESIRVLGNAEDPKVSYQGERGSGVSVSCVKVSECAACETKVGV